MSKAIAAASTSAGLNEEARCQRNGRRDGTRAVSDTQNEGKGDWTLDAGLNNARYRSTLFSPGGLQTRFKPAWFTKPLKICPLGSSPAT
jgi:hypothetical protein